MKLKLVTLFILLLCMCLAHAYDTHLFNKTNGGLICKEISYIKYREDSAYIKSIKFIPIPPTDTLFFQKTKLQKGNLCYRIVLQKVDSLFKGSYALYYGGSFSHGSFYRLRNGLLEQVKYDETNNCGKTKGAFYTGILIDNSNYTDTLYLDITKEMSGAKKYFGLCSYEEYTHQQLTILNKEKWPFTIRLVFTFFLITQIIYVLFQWYFHKDSIYLNYLGYMSCLLYYFFINLIMISHWGLPFGISGSYWFEATTLMLFLPNFFYYKFARGYLGTAEHFPEKDYQIRISEYAILLVIAVYLVLTKISRTALFIFMLLVTIALFVYNISLIIHFFKRKNVITRFLLWGSIAASTGHFVAMLISYLHYLNLISILYVDAHIITISGLFLEIILFNIGLGYRSKVESEARLQAQQQLMAELKKNEKLTNDLTTVRNNIANDLHDDVGSTLSSISLYGELASKQMNSNPEISRNTLDKIVTSAQRMLESMNEIIWVIHSKHDIGEDIASRMNIFLADRLDAIGMNHKFEANNEARQLSLDMYVKRNLILFFKEAINNAAKYSQAKLVSCNMYIERDELVLEIKDDGKGMPENVNYGHGIKSIEERIKKSGGMFFLGSLPGKGTTLTARIPLSKAIDRSITK
ncbi:MAG: sensor histidine kinase [Bacteroidetes bacterium]|nr:sensor histidine kinase [Bacteroidota bacterium]